MNRKKVLIFIQDGVGGAERMSVLIGKNLSSNLFNVRFCLVDCGAKNSIKDFLPSSIFVERIIRRNPLILAIKMVKSIMLFRPDVVFSSVFNLNTKFLLFRWLFPSVKVIVRCDNYLYTYNKMQQILIKNTYPEADVIIAQTEEMRDELISIGIPVVKMVVLHNPKHRQTIEEMLKNVESPYPSNGRKHFVASGRFAYQKGFDYLLDAFIMLNNKRDDCDLYIVGDYEYDNRKVYNQIMSRAQSMGVANRVFCLGYQTNPYRYVKFADCFVLSSRWEGLPNVLIESLYLGTPVAAFKCVPVIERIVENCKTGFHSVKGDIESLCIAMNSALSLGRIKSTYLASDISDFVNLFA